MRFYTSPPSCDSETQQSLMNMHYNLMKCRAMWALRHLEAEIDAEDGVLILSDVDGDLSMEAKGFSQEIYEKISAIITPGFWRNG